MTTLIQDWKVLQNANKNVRREKRNLRKLRKSMVVSCNIEVFGNNIERVAKFASVLRDNKDKLSKDLINECSVKYRASSCFYRLYVRDVIGYEFKDPFFGFKEKFEIPFKVKTDIVNCPNVPKDCMFDEERCAGCAHFDGLIDFLAQRAQFETAAYKHAIAKQKFISHFLKQKGK